MLTNDALEDPAAPASAWDAWLASGQPARVLADARTWPASRLQHNPRSAYLAGFAAAQTGDATFLQWMDHAFTGFAAGKDAAGTLLTAATAIRSIASDFGTLAPAATWLTRLRDALAAPTPALSDADRLMVDAGVLAASTLLTDHGLDDARVAASAAAMQATLMGPAGGIDVNVRVWAVESLLEYYAHTGRRGHTEQMALRVTPWLDDPALCPLFAGRWHFWLGNHFRFLDEPAKGIAQFERARRIGDAHALPWVQFNVLRACLRSPIESGQYAATRPLLASMEALLDFQRPLDVADYHHLKGWIALLEGDARHAQEDFVLAREAAVRGAYPTGADFYRSMEAYALIALDDAPGAIAIFEALAYNQSARFQAVQRGLVALTRAWQLRSQGDAAYAQQLREGFAAAREYNLVQLLRPLPLVVAQLCADALARGIEREFLYKVIAARRLQPPADAGAGWPWPIKIRTLGTFDVLLDDAPPAFGRKTQKKPLDLLKLIIAMGGRDVPADMLIDALWTSADDVGSLGALEMLIARLRKLLRNPDAVLVADRRISLNADLVWVDALALEPQLTRWLANTGGARNESAQWLALYPGHFLPSDGDSPVLLARRDRLWSLASRYIECQGAELLRQQAYGEAVEIYRRAIELDLLAEGFYRNLMVCYRELGHRAEAIDVFRRLRQNLAVMLGIKPSAPTEAVYQSLQQQP